MGPETKNDIDLPARVQALLFSAGEPMSIKRLIQSLDATPDGMKAAIEELAKRLEAGPIQLVRSETEVALAVSSVATETVKKAQEKELSRDIGDAGLEVLAICLYKGPSTRSQIDYVRGVNTASTVRNLLARGLLERTGNPEDGREYLYRPTVELLAHLGAKSAQELPEYATITSELAAFASQQAPIEQHGSSSNNLHDES